MTAKYPRVFRVRGSRSFGVAAVGCWLWFGSGCGSRSSLALGEPSETVSPALPGSSSPSTSSGGAAVATPPATAGSPAAPVRPPAVPACEAVTVTIDSLRPAVTLLVDQSGSMRSGYPTRDSEQTRWSIVRQALLDPLTGVVKSLEQSLQFGLVFYTSHNGFSGGTCPILSEVRAATNNYEGIRTLYDGMQPDDDTPTGAAVSQVVTELQSSGRRGTEVILLVTDGDPDTCEVPDPQLGQLEAVAAVSAAHAAKIDFYVLGISSDISGDNLQQLANAGQGKRLAAVWGVDADAAQPFQASDSVAGLTAQLRDILARVPLCEVKLDRDVGADELGTGSVILDGQRLANGSPDGFKLKDPRHLEIVGKACATLRAAGKQLSVRLSCD
jgi:hypothetical protein